MNGLLGRSITALALVLCAGLLLLPSSASASRPHAVIPPFGSAGSGSGQFELAFNSGIAVNEATHDVYVADTGNHRVDEFDSSGNFVRAFGADVGGLGVDVCTIGCVAGTAGSSPGALENPTFIAVDNSPGGEGDVYVADTAANLVTKFKADGTLVSSWGVGGQLDGLSADQPFSGPFSELIGIAVDAAGNLDVLQRPEHVLFRFAPDSTFLTDFETPRGSTEMGLAVDSSGNFFKVNGEPSVQKFDSLGASLGRVTSSTSSTGLAVDASTSELYVDNNGESIDAYVFLPSGEVEGTGCNPSSPEFEFGCLPTETFAHGSLTAGGALATDGTSHTTYAVDWGAARIVGFRLEILPQVETEAATGVDKDSAVLHGAVNPAGGQPASCEFQYTTREAFDSGGFAGATSVPCVPPGPFNGTTAESVSAELNGLAPGTVYVFRLVADNAEGTTNGPELEFLTPGPPLVSGESASEIGAHGAKLSGLVDPKGATANYSFQYVSESQFDESGYAEATTVPLPAATLPSAATGIGDISGIVVTADLVAGSTELFNLKNLAGEELEFSELEFGQAVFGPGIPAGTTIVNIKGFFRLSQAATASAEGVTLSIGKFAVANVTPTGGRFTVGQIVSGPGIPFDTKIKAVEPSRLLLSKLPTETTRGANLIASGPQSASQFISGLTEDTIYHFRLVAGNGEGSVAGPDATFSTISQAPSSLPDARAYEMVSPPKKAGEVFAPEPAGWFGGSCEECLPGNQFSMLPMQSTANGDSVVYSGQPFEEGLAAFQNQYLARRSPGGWATQSLTPAVPRTGTYRMFSSDLTRSIISQGRSILSPEAPVNGGGVAYQNLYLREEGGATPLVVQAPPSRTAEEGAERFEIEFAGANAGQSDTELTHVVFQANDALTAAEGELAPAAPAVGSSERDLYEWQNGKLQLVNVLPGNTGASLNGVIGSGHLLNEHPTQELAALDNAISADGNRVFWTDTETGNLYVREGGAATVEIPTAGECRANLPLELRVCFLTASANGSKVLLSDGTIRDVETPADPPVDLTSGSGGFQGIMGTSADLSRIYFVDTAILTGGEENANHELAEAGALNIYARSGGTTSFLGRLASQDGQVNGNFFAVGDFKVAAAGRTSQVSPDGKYLTFMSTARLTGYDNEIQGGGQCRPSPLGCYEIFVYEASSAKLICASCRSSLTRPLASANLSLIKPVPGVSTPRQPGNLSTGGSGRLFFESRDVLSPLDTNGSIQDIYEWEPNGVGNCKRVDGCVALISSGNSPVDSMFVDSTPSGDDAFFITRQQLVPEDTDEQLDLYDARVGGGIEPGGAPAPCGGEACKAPIAPAPAVPNPGSSSVSGAGNVKPGSKKKHHRKRRHQKKRHQANKHKANNNGGSK